MVEDRNATPADVARVRIDFGSWLGTLSRRDRRIAEILSVGETTGNVASRFHVSPGRVSQLRRELAQSWHEFQADATGPTARSDAVASTHPESKSHTRKRGGPN